MRTSGAGNDSFMTLVILCIALGVSMVVFGGPAEFARAVNDLVRDLVASGVALAQRR